MTSIVNQGQIVSVVLPFYNSELHIKESILSIINQTYKNIELILVNDGSTDSSLDIVDNLLKEYNFTNYKILTHENSGVGFSLNRGIHEASGKYVARMDADDLAHKDRIAMQVGYMESSDFDVVGSYVSTKNGGIVKVPTTDSSCKFQLFFRTCFIHPAVLGRREVFLLNPYKNISGEDYELWTRLSVLGYKFSNIKFPTLVYREHNLQATKIKHRETENTFWESNYEYRKNYRFNMKLIFKYFFFLLLNIKLPLHYYFLKMIRSQKF